MAQAPAGWYPDPSGAPGQRYWDGTTWTQWTHPAASGSARVVDSDEHRRDSAMSDAPGSRVGSVFGPYHLKRLLGRGGMGEVYEAEHTVKERTVAVKLMADQLSKDPVFGERMKREARIAARLREAHVVPVHDYGEIDGKLFIELRLIRGSDLDSVLKRFGPLTPPRTVAIISQIASALDAAHAAGAMHGDVKPSNILVTREDFAYLVDFGIASATTDEKPIQLDTAVGTWKYMAPERFSNDDVTYRADIYALACVLYECLTGYPPYPAIDASTLVTAHLMDAIPHPSTARAGIPKAFDAVIARGMAKEPQDRYARAGDLALGAHDALSDPDQDHVDDVLRRSWEATRADSGLGDVEYLLELLADQTRVLGPDHPDTLEVRFKLARCRGEVGDAAGARTDYENLLVDQVRILGDNHADTRRTRNALRGPALGDAWLEEDGSITMRMRRTSDGINVSGTLTYKPTDKRYGDVMEHLGGLKPGEVKLVYPWDT